MGGKSWEEQYTRVSVMEPLLLTPNGSFTVSDGQSSPSSSFQVANRSVRHVPTVRQGCLEPRLQISLYDERTEPSVKTGINFFPN